MKGQIFETEDEEYTLVQVPYISECGEYYKAMAYDSSGDEVVITWDILRHDCEDESEACDWNKFDIN